MNTKYIGKWRGRADTPFFKGSAEVDIFDNGGEYGFNANVQGFDKLPEFSVYDIKEGENSLSGKADINMFGKITAEIEVHFNENDTFTGEIRLPVFGTVQILDGRRIK